ncbi:MAG: hypothetical protein KIT31_16935 [Deltaproteobacteria bacterium]|nr:hypothetical protein [Deltaproteobacteria bacterium]
MDFRDAYLEQSQPTTPIFHALEQWRCSKCRSPQWAILEFERIDEDNVRFIGATPTLLTEQSLEGVNYITRMMDMWIDANPGDEIDAIRARIAHLLPGGERHSS